MGRIGQTVVGGVTSGIAYAATHHGSNFNTLVFATEVVSGAASGYLGGNGLLKGNTGSKVAKQIKIIDANMHAVKTNWKAARSVAVSYSRIRGHVHKTVKQYIAATVGVASGKVIIINNINNIKKFFAK